ncbi:MAG: Cof-type HAD-IIB family hydrolase [Nocardioides sp.]|uniref:Cof-type HAD-IIB family hydrolase n=1 Tax=Nocardioides sp. TaxID=35761 RepID=UPI00238CA27E|nr:Cof-type HAD-IIB family hydrolase [Nocardioides sp.]MDE0776951.1 Cof-type HAD-IIB family hydrolase [Nocardioides sp.]
MTHPDMTRPALIATDLDGTLLRSDGTLSDASRRVLAAVEDAGVPVVFVTGRPVRWMVDLWEVVGAHGLAIVSNGAVLYDVAQRAVRRVDGLAPEPGLAMVELLREVVPQPRFAIECLDGLRLEADFHDPHRVPPGSPVGALSEVWDDVAVKVLVRHDGVDDRVLDDVARAVGDRAVPTWSMPGLLEISAPGVTKAAALARLCADLDVSAADVVAFGDMPNDLAMLGWAGTSYAVANAHDDVRAAAHHTAETNDDDGVARVMARLVGLTDDLVQ